MTALRLRPYQQEAAAAVHEAWSNGMQRPAVVLPTGTGKTPIEAKLMSERRRGVFLVHRDELARQAMNKLRAVNPDLRIGLVKAGDDDVDADMIVASVQTLARSNRMERFLDAGRPDVIIADEAHFYAAPTFVRVLKELGAFSGVPTAGFTATMSRTDDRGLGDVWQDVVYKRDILWAIINGYLVDVEAKSIEIDGLDLRTVARNRGDFQEGSLGEALEACGAGPVIADAVKRYAGDRQGVMFTPTVATAYSFGEELDERGLKTEIVTGETPIAERDRIYDRLWSGATQYVSNCNVLTVGWDMPPLSTAVIARATESQPFFSQMVGRVLRPHPGKERALILDAVGSGGSLRSIVDLSETQIQPQEGKSLREMYEAGLEEQEVAQGTLTGAVSVKQRELFDTSSSVWLQTKRGYWFIPTRECYIFLYPVKDSHLFKVARTGDRYDVKGGGWIKEEPVELPYAMAWGEQAAEDIDATVASRSATWRQAGVKPSKQQKKLADQCKIPYTDGTTKSELNDRISIFFANKVLDRVLK